MDKVILIGTGGHARSVYDAALSMKIEICGFLDEYNVGECYGKPIFGTKPDQIPNYRHYKYFVAIGDIQARKRWYKYLKKMNLEIINIIDDSAIISCSSILGEGNFIGKMAIINAGVKIGDNNIINTKALVEHDCIVGNHTHLSTNSVINGHVVVQDGVFLGSGAVCIDHVNIGEYTTIGAGSVVIKDIPENSVAVGIPARLLTRG